MIFTLKTKMHFKEKSCAKKKDYKESRNNSGKKRKAKSKGKKAKIRENLPEKMR